MKRLKINEQDTMSTIVNNMTLSKISNLISNNMDKPMKESIQINNSSIARI